MHSTAAGYSKHCYHTHTMWYLVKAFEGFSAQLLLLWCKVYDLKRNEERICGILLLFMGLANFCNSGNFLKIFADSLDFYLYNELLFTFIIYMELAIFTTMNFFIYNYLFWVIFLY